MLLQHVYQLEPQMNTLAKILDYHHCTASPQGCAVKLMDLTADVCLPSCAQCMPSVRACLEGTHYAGNRATSASTLAGHTLQRKPCACG